MRKYKTIQVLWVEDDPEVAENYPREAEMLAQIELHPFRCWKDAERLLRKIIPDGTPFSSMPNVAIFLRIQTKLTGF